MGHDFGEVLTDRDRHERGDEVVVTIREYRECARCGETRVVSENKEVRHAGPSARAAPGDGLDLDAAESEGLPATDAVEGFDDVTAEEDDGVILEDEPVPREPGAWPETDESAPDEGGASEEPAPWPTVEGEDEGYAAEPSDGGPLEGVEFRAGLTPEAAAPDPSGSAPADAGGDVVESPGPADRGGFRSATSAPSATGRHRTDALDTEFFCPECEFVTPTEDSSLRPGDICPNCHLGYLTERER